MPLPRLLPVLVCIVAAALHFASDAIADDKPPNFVFILVDDLGWTDLGCFGSALYETPNIDRRAAQGMRFTSGRSNGSIPGPGEP